MNWQTIGRYLWLVIVVTAKIILILCGLCLTIMIAVFVGTMKGGAKVQTSSRVAD